MHVLEGAQGRRVLENGRGRLRVAEGRAADLFGKIRVELFGRLLEAHIGI